MAVPRRGRTQSRCGRVVLLAVALLAAYCAAPWHASPSARPALAAVPAGEEAPKENFFTKVLGAAVKGAVAAVVAALLSAFTEPIVNKVLVKRILLMEAIKDTKIMDCLKFSLTTIPTNLLKFPIFEVIHMILSFTTFPAYMTGVVNGFLFCTLMLPVTNYRFNKSMGKTMEWSDFYKAYPQTVLRDIVYGWARGIITPMLTQTFTATSASLVGKSWLFGVTVFLACVISAPFNELRAFSLQPAATKKSFKDFFKPINFIRSTSVGATIMGIALMIGMLITPYAESGFEAMKENPLYAIPLVAVAGLGVAYSQLNKPAKRTR